MSQLFTVFEFVYFVNNVFKCSIFSENSNTVTGFVAVETDFFNMDIVGSSIETESPEGLSFNSTFGEIKNQFKICRTFLIITFYTELWG